MSLIQLGHVVLSSGATSNYKLECGQFIEDNLDGLVQLIRQMAGPFSSVEGVPRGGLRLAEAMKPFVSISGPHLIVDDCLTTGGSMERLKATHALPKWEPAGKPGIIGAVVFARGQTPHWVRPLFQIHESLWLQPRHR